MNKLLKRSSLRYMWRHPWQIGLSILGIAVGVSVVIAIDLANQSANRAFSLSMDSVTGKATHQIVGASAGVPDSVFVRLRNELGFRKSAPVIESYVKYRGAEREVFYLMGVDAFSEAPFRGYMQGLGSNINGEFGEFMTNPRAVVMSTDKAGKLGLAIGDSLRIQIGSRHESLIISGLLKPEDDYSNHALETMLFVDIAAAQRLLRMPGYVSRIDLLLPTDEENSNRLETLRAWLPENLRLTTSGARNEATLQMIRAFDLNLTALSLLALVVGMFLIFNTMTFSVVRRKKQLGLLRSLGVTRREIFRLIIGEALLLGIIGTALGISLGIFLGQFLVQLVSQTINDLYFVLTVNQMTVSAASLLKGIGLGVGVSWLAAIRPAREATTASIRQVMNRSRQESNLRQNIPRLTLIGISIMALGGLVLLIPTRNLIVSYSGILPMLIGATLLTPLAIYGAMRFVRPLMSKAFGMLGRMATRDVTAHMTRTGVAIAALSIAVAATIGVDTMITSFRSTVVHWLESRLQADIYISPPSLLSRRNSATLEPEFVARLQQVEGIDYIGYFRENMIPVDGRMMHLVASTLAKRNFDSFDLKSGDPDEVFQAFKSNEGLLVSEPYAFHNDVDIGSVITIPTDRGERQFTVAGIYYDYGSDIGLVIISFDVYRQYWDNHRISGISVYGKKEMDIERLADTIRQVPGPDEEVLIRSNQFLKQTSIEIFDRTFLITSVLHILAIGVAFIGVFSALMSLQLERTHELAVLRANGLTPRELRKMLTLQTGLMGLVSGLLAIPLGLGLAALLIFVVNQRSFGWSLQFQVMPEILAQSLLLAVFAALLAGLYPAYKMSNSSPALALKEE